MRALSADAAVVHPAARAAGRVRVPGDKSVSHRYALLAALADGASTITGYSPGADCASTLGCLEALGVRIARTAPVSREMILNYVAEHSLGLPKSY